MDLDELRRPCSIKHGQACELRLFLDLLVHFQRIKIDESQWIDEIRRNFSMNENESISFDQFVNDYHPDDSFSWFIDDTPIHRIFTNALLNGNFRHLFYLRILISDLQQQIENHRCTTTRQLYRFQWISKSEFIRFENPSRQYISSDSFLLTNSDRKSALTLLHQSNLFPKAYRPVLFIIHADPSVINATSFTEINQLNSFRQENSVLFAFGAIFRIDQFSYSNQDQCWTVEMYLTDDNPNRSIFDAMRQEYQSGNTTSLLSLGRLARTVGKLDDADFFYKQYLKQNSNNQINRAQCFHLLGNLALDQGHYQSSQGYHEESLKIRMNSLPINESSLAYNYNSLGLVHWKLGNQTGSLEFFHKALEIWRRIYGDRDLKVAMCWNNIGIIYDDQKNYQHALNCYEKVLQIRLKVSPLVHRDLADTSNNIGAVYHRLGYFDSALTAFFFALNTYENSSGVNHSTIGSIWMNIGATYQSQLKYHDAYDAYQTADNHLKYSLPHSHQDRLTIQRIVSNLTMKFTNGN